MLIGASRAACATASPPRLAAARAGSCGGTSHAFLPQTPLFLRPPTITAALQDLQAWRDWARRLALSVGSSFSDADGGPDSELLCRELNWVLEDAVEDYGKVRGMVGGDEDLVLVRARAGLEELYGLWKERVEKRRPFQYLVGCQHWRDMVLAVQEGVLIPRPETEMIVDVVGEAVAREGRLGEGVWADLGTGSGAIGIGIGRVLGGGGRVIATDVSSIAVAVARFNAERYGLQVSCLVN